MSDAANIRLAEITPENFHAVIKLKVGDGQESYVASNVYSIAESRVFPYLEPFAVYADDNIVGFAMTAHYPPDNKIFISRLMIDTAFQGQGIGRAVMRKLIEKLAAESNCSEIFLSCVPGNPAEKLYSSLGFEPTGDIDEDGEMKMCLKLNK